MAKQGQSNGKPTPPLSPNIEKGTNNIPPPRNTPAPPPKPVKN